VPRYILAMPHHWTDHDYLVFDIRFTLSHGELPRRLRRVFTEDERRAVAQAIVTRLRQGWVITRKPGPEFGASAMSRREPQR
jgi:hypothetical protein